jgi:hypothetical protein
MPFFHQQSRAELRRVYIESWRKFRGGEPLEPLEAQVAALVAEHPEYHALLEASTAAPEAEYFPEAGAPNPFLHLALHLAVREQVTTDRPAGVRAIHAALAARLHSAHEAEHRMLEVLGEVLWEAQRSQSAPDEQRYLERLRNLRSSAGG